MSRPLVPSCHFLAITIAHFLESVRWIESKRQSRCMHAGVYATQASTKAHAWCGLGALSLVCGSAGTKGRSCRAWVSTGSDQGGWGTCAERAECAECRRDWRGRPLDAAARPSYCLVVRLLGCRWDRLSKKDHIPVDKFYTSSKQAVKPVNHQICHTTTTESLCVVKPGEPSQRKRSTTRQHERLLKQSSRHRAALVGIRLSGATQSSALYSRTRGVASFGVGGVQPYD
eukprot:1195574-Prorocentrum_minimum.AAC.13